jgi:membrane-bound lytic murein transglycosylase D
MRRVTFKAAKGGDSVAAVARRHGVSVDQVAQWNAVAVGAVFRPGQTILVMKSAQAKSTVRKTAAPSTRATASRPSAKPSAKVAVTKPAAKL